MVGINRNRSSYRSETETRTKYHNRSSNYENRKEIKTGQKET
jgi:hypothetical protein